jgi:sortase A
MSDDSPLDDATIEELEEILAEKRRARALKRFRRVSDGETQAPDAFADIYEVTSRRSRETSGTKDGEGKSESHAAPELRTRATSMQGAIGHQAPSFKAVKIIPETSAVDGAVSVLSRANKPIWRRGFTRLRDRLLLLLELAALAGLIFVVFSTLSNLRVLNKEVAEALEPERGATPVATPATVLPGGSLPPGSEGTVPDQLRHLVEPGASIPIPTPGPRQASRIIIPAIEIDVPVVEGDGWEELKMGAGHRIGSANPGERGNVVVSGHNDVYGEIFRYLEDLNIGNEVIVYAGDTPYSYLVAAKMVVEPTEVSLLEPTPNATLTLITCHPYMIDTQRLVIIAELANQ